MSDPVSRINALREKSQGTRRALWERIQLESPEMAAFMREAKRQLNARATEITLGGKTVWEKSEGGSGDK